MCDGNIALIFLYLYLLKSAGFKNYLPILIKAAQFYCYYYYGLGFYLLPKMRDSYHFSVGFI